MPEHSTEPSTTDETLHIFFVRIDEEAALKNGEALEPF